MGDYILMASVIVAAFAINRHFGFFGRGRIIMEPLTSWDFYTLKPRSEQEEFYKTLCKDNGLRYRDDYKAKKDLVEKGITHYPCILFFHWRRLQFFKEPVLCKDVNNLTKVEITEATKRIPIYKEYLDRYTSGQDQEYKVAQKKAKAKQGQRARHRTRMAAKDEKEPPKGLTPAQKLAFIHPAERFVED